MNYNFRSSLEDIENIAKKNFINIFDEPVKKFYSDMKKNIKFLRQDMQRLDFGEKDLVKLYNDVREKMIKNSMIHRFREKEKNSKITLLKHSLFNTQEILNVSL